MKHRRIWALLLAAAMLLTMLPAAAQEGETAQQPELILRMLEDYDSEGNLTYFPDEALSALDVSQGKTAYAVVCWGTETDNTTGGTLTSGDESIVQVKAERVTVPTGIVTYYAISFIGVGTAQLIYTDADGAHVQSVTVDIPEGAGLYTARERSAAVFAQDLIYTGDEIVLYSMSADGYTQAQVDNLEAAINYEAHDRLTVETLPREDGNYDVKLTIPAGLDAITTEGVTVSLYNQVLVDGETKFRYLGGTAVYARGLLWAEIDWASGGVTGSYSPDGYEFGIHEAWQVAVGAGALPEDFVPDSTGTLTVDDPDILQVRRRASGGLTYYDFTAVGFGTATLTLTTAAGKAYSAAVTVELPRDGALYSRQERSAGAYLHTIVYDSAKSLEVWLMCEAGYTKDELNGSGCTLNHEIRDDIPAEIVLRPGTADRYDVKVTLPAGLSLAPSGVSFAVNGVDNGGARLYPVQETALLLDKVWDDSGAPSYAGAVLAGGLSIPYGSGIIAVPALGTPYEYIHRPDAQLTGSNPDVFTVSVESVAGMSAYGIWGVDYGTADLTCTVDGAVYTVSVTVDLPYAGFYSAPERSRETYLASITYEKDKELTVYLLQEGGLPSTDGAVVRIDGEIVPGATATQVQLPNGALGLCVTLPAGLEMNEYSWLEASGSDFGCGCQLVRGQESGLVMRNMEWDSAGQGYREGRGYEQMSALQATPGYIACFRPYYGTAEASTALTGGTLTSGNPDIVSVTQSSDESLDGEPYYEIRALAFGMANVTYTAADGTSYTAQVSVCLPGGPAFYSQPRRGEDTYLSCAEYDSEAGLVLYFLAPAGFSKDQAESSDLQARIDTQVEPGVTFSAVMLSDGTYGIRIEFPAGLAGIDENSWLELSGAGLGGYGLELTRKQEPGLRVLYMIYDSAKNAYVPSFDYIPAVGELDICMGETHYLRLAYGTPSHFTTLAGGTLISGDPGILSVSQSAEESADGQPYFALRGEGVGTSELTYEGADGERYTAVASVGLPRQGYYARAERSADAYLKQAVFDPAKGLTVYYMTKRAMTLEEAQAMTAGISDVSARVEYTPEALGDGEGYALKITVPAGVSYPEGADRMYLNLSGGPGLELISPDSSEAGIDRDFTFLRYDGGVPSGTAVSDALAQPRATRRTWQVLYKGQAVTDFTAVGNDGAAAAVSGGLLVLDSGTSFGASVTVEYQGVSTTVPLNFLEDGIYTFRDENDSPYTLVLGTLDAQGSGTLHSGGMVYEIREDQVGGAAGIAMPTFGVSLLSGGSRGEEQLALIDTYIASVTFRILDDPDGLLSLGTALRDTDGTGRYLIPVTLASQAGGGLVAADVTLKNGATVTLTAGCAHSITRSVSYDCDELGISSMEALQALIDSIGGADDTGEELVVSLQSGGLYEGWLVIPDSPRFQNLTIQGRGAVIRGGIKLQGVLDIVNDVVFEASDAVRDGEGRTVALLCDGGELFNVSACTFTGYDVAVDSNASGYICPGQSNLFRRNVVALRIDCAGRKSGSANSNVRSCAFVGNGTAIEIIGLPDYISPYYYRVFFCDFMGNTLDVSAAGLGSSVYFYRNYFGGTDRGYRSAVVTGPVRTELRYAQPIGLDTFLEDWQGDYPGTEQALTLDTGADYAELLNDEAGELLLGSAELNRDVTLAVVERTGSIAGLWTFRQADTRAARRALSLRSAGVDFDGGLAVTADGDGLRITITDSQALRERTPELTIPCYESWAGAEVTLAGESVDARWDSQAHTVTFSVAAGGAYVITPAQPPLRAQLDAGRTRITVTAGSGVSTAGCRAWVALYDGSGRQVGLVSGVFTGGTVTLNLPGGVSCQRIRVFLLDERLAPVTAAAEPEG